MPAAAYLPMYTDAEVAAHNHGYNTAALETLCGDVLALQLPFLEVSESMANHDSKIVDAGSID
jgi:hypothetical protein